MEHYGVTNDDRTRNSVESVFTSAGTFMSIEEPHAALRLFISSTYEDLQPYVERAKAVLRNEHVQFDHFKEWEATGRPSAHECKDRVRKCDALIVIVGHTYGWIPTAAAGGDGRSSITRLEVEWALEKPIAVLPFFVEEPGISPGESDPDTRRLMDEFLSELHGGLGKPVASLSDFDTALRNSVIGLARTLREHRRGAPAQVGERVQGRYQTFFDRVRERGTLRKALIERGFRGASIVGKGGFGKSALANMAIDELRDHAAIDVVVYLGASRTTPINEFGLFMAIMEASGEPKISFEGSWTALSRNSSRLVDVLLDACRHRRMLVFFDAVEHNLSHTGEIHPTPLREFVEQFLVAKGESRLLITSRQPVWLPEHAVPMLREVRLDRGLRATDAKAWLTRLAPDVASMEDVDTAIQAVGGIPYVLERMANVLRQNRHLGLSKAAVRLDALDAFAALAQSTLSAAARQVLQARAVFDEPVGEDALMCLLDGCLSADQVTTAVKELARGSFLFRVGSGDLLGLHEVDQESSYRSIGGEGDLTASTLHRRAADYYARRCRTESYWFDWASYDDVINDVKRFNHLVHAGDPMAAGVVLGIDKVQFLNYGGHVDLVRSMFGNLAVPPEPSRALLIKQYALADSMVIVGPFEQAITAMQDVVALARQLGDVKASLSARYELGLAYRYVGRSEEAIEIYQDVTEQLRDMGESRWFSHCLYSYSLACSYAGRYREAIRLGKEQVRQGRHYDEPSVVGRGNSSLCLVYHLMERPQDAARCARQSISALMNTRYRYAVGFVENVLGLSLCSIGDVSGALAAFERAAELGRVTGHRRVEGLAATNSGWVRYVQGDIDEALRQIRAGLRVFIETSARDDRQLADHLREAFEYAADGDRSGEISALIEFVESAYENPDLVARTTVARRILDSSDVSAGFLGRAESVLDVARQKLAALKDA